MSVPRFERYYPSLGDLNTKQRRFYDGFERRIADGEFVDVEGNIGYVFIYLYGLLERWAASDLSALSDDLIHVGELYGDERTIADYCAWWAYDCLFGQERFEEFLDRTEGISIGKYFASDRLTAQR